MLVWHACFCPTQDKPTCRLSHPSNSLMDAFLLLPTMPACPSCAALLLLPAGVPAIPFIGPVPFKYWGDNFTLAFTGAVAMAFVETARYMVGGAGV